MHLTRMHAPTVAVDDPALFPHIHPKGTESGQVQINWTQADFASPGICNRRPAKPGENRPEQEDRRADLLGELVGHLAAVHAAGPHRYFVAAPGNIASQHPQYIRHAPHIQDIRHMMQLHRVLRQDARGQDGQRRVLRAVHPERAFQAFAALYHQCFHTRHLHRDGTAYAAGKGWFLMT